MSTTRVTIFLLIAASLSVSGCVTSKSALLGPDTRVLPFALPMKFQVYERSTDGDLWTRKQDMTLVADQHLEIRDEKAPSSDVVTLHREDRRRYLVQANTKKYYIYGVLVIENGEGVLTWMDCSKMDRQAVRSAGGRVLGDGSASECQLDGASRPLDLLRSMATHAAGYQQRYVPLLAAAPGGLTQALADQDLEQARCIVNDPTPTSAPLQMRAGPNRTKDNPLTGSLYNGTKVQLLDFSV